MGGEAGGGGGGWTKSIVSQLRRAGEGDGESGGMLPRENLGWGYPKGRRRRGKLGDELWRGNGAGGGGGGGSSDSKVGWMPVLVLRLARENATPYFLCRERDTMMI